MCFHNVSDWVESTLVWPQDVSMFVFSVLPINSSDNILQDGIRMQYVVLGRGGGGHATCSTSREAVGKGLGRYKGDFSLSGYSHLALLARKNRKQSSNLKCHKNKVFHIDLEEMGRRSHVELRSTDILRIAVINLCLLSPLVKMWAL